jgi:hypothetical protein
MLSRVAGILAEIQTEHIPNENLELYRYASLLAQFLTKRTKDDATQ